MSHPPKRLDQQESPSPSLTFTQHTLGQLMDSVEGMLHPSLYKKTLRQIGVNIGRSASLHHLETHKTGKPYSAQDYIACIEGLKEHLGLECSATEATENSITFQIPVCAFGQCAANTDICLVESGILGGIAGDYFGESKVSIHRGKGSPPQNCHAVVYLRRSEQSVTAEGTVYPEEFDSPNDRVSGTKPHLSLARLSLRERQILRLVGEGLSNRHIAAAVHLSVRTVEGHLSRIHAKLEIKGRTDLIRLALRSDLSRL
ncbi:MAG: LuxR family transcriptional regulator [Nitrospirae bacterium]|nr:MAG: LuxR family transcriptional regulator [Nitrospirota bacterium]